MSDAINSDNKGRHLLNVFSRLVAAESAEPRFMQEEEESSEEEEEELSPEKQGSTFNVIICHTTFLKDRFSVEDWHDIVCER